MAGEMTVGPTIEPLVIPMFRGLEEENFIDEDVHGDEYVNED